MEFPRLQALTEAKESEAPKKKWKSAMEYLEHDAVESNPYHSQFKEAGFRIGSTGGGVEAVEYRVGNQSTDEVRHKLHTILKGFKYTELLLKTYSYSSRAPQKVGYWAKGKDGVVMYYAGTRVNTVYWDRGGEHFKDDELFDVHQAVVNAMKAASEPSGSTIIDLEVDPEEIMFSVSYDFPEHRNGIIPEVRKALNGVAKLNAQKGSNYSSDAGIDFQIDFASEIDDPKKLEKRLQSEFKIEKRYG